MNRLSRFQFILLFMLLVGCSTPEAATKTGTQISVAASQSSAEATHVPSSTATSFVSSPVPTQTLEPTTAPTLPACHTGLLVFSAQIHFDPTKSGIFMACENGSFVQQILELSYSVRSIAISPDGKNLAFVEEATSQSRSLKLVSLSNLSAAPSTLVTGEEPLLDVTWSPDGKYLSFIRQQMETGYGILSVLHLETMTETSLLTEDWLTDVDWSPDGKQLLLGTYGVMPTTIDVRVTDISCNPEDHTCALGKETEIKHVYFDPSWTPDGRDIITSVRAGNPLQKLISVTNLASQTIREIDLTTLLPPEAFRPYDAVMSPDGKRIAFVTDSEDTQNTNVYVLDLPTMTLVNLTANLNIIASSPVWMP